MRALIIGGLIFFSGQLYATPQKTNQSVVVVEKIPANLSFAWGIVPLASNSVLVTEKVGKLKRVDLKTGKSEVITGVPEVYYKGQGGLLDIALDPDFKTNKLIYLSYAELDKKTNKSGTAVGRGKLVGSTLKNFERIWQQTPKIDSPLHFGSRLSFSPKGHLFITTGDRYYNMQDAQTLNNHLGKVIRIWPDGSIPQDNPFLKKKGALKDIWSYGHRNVQGAAHHPVTGQFYSGEHGAKGGDEINLTRAGKNYGWPVITHGVDYSGEKIGEGRFKKGMEQPIHFWNPSIASCGMIIYSGKMFEEWKHDFIVTSLKLTHLSRISIGKDGSVSEEKMMDNIDMRMRDVAEAPDGSLLIVFDQEAGPIFRVSKK